MHSQLRSALMVLAGVLLLLPQAWSTTVLEMNLDQLCDSAGMIIRGKVVDVSETSVRAGGGRIKAVEYTIQVEEALKGSVDTVKGQDIAKFKMIGSLKQHQLGRAPIPGFPVLKMGGDYLLMIAPPGPVGLTSTMGLGQGAFSIVMDAGSRQEMAVNGFNNASLFKGMGAGLPAAGPVAYDMLTDRIRSAVNN